MDSPINSLAKAVTGKITGQIDLLLVKNIPGRGKDCNLLHVHQN